jgi:hypothetical protein
MKTLSDLIPPAPTIREQLARNLRERRLLRSLLNLSIRAAEERQRQRQSDRDAPRNSGGPIAGRAARTEAPTSRMA